MLTKKRATRKYKFPKISITLSMEEVIAVSMMLKMGTFFTRPEELRKVEGVLSRIEKRLTALGFPRESIDILVKL